MQIAARVLKIRQGQAERPVSVSLNAPEIGPGGGWYCSYAIAWPNDDRRAEGWGVDAVQALQVTLERIGLDLYTSPYHAAGELLWEKPGAGYGFPVPQNCRDLLIGEDAIYL